MLEMQGYVPSTYPKSYRPETRYTRLNRGKAILATTFGTQGLEKESALMVPILIPPDLI